MSASPSLLRLAEAAGLETTYTRADGARAEASTASVLAALSALGPGLGFELGGSADDDALGRAHAALVAARQRDLAPPVVVAWDGAGTLPLWVRADLDADWALELVDEAGARQHAAGRLFHLPASDHASNDGVTRCWRHVELPLAGRHGWFTARWQVGADAGTSTIIAAPTVAYGAPGGPPRWGVFAPLYGLRTPGSGACGDLETLAQLRQEVAARGGSYVATLPLLAQFLDQPCEVSPYAPASRLFWNELYLPDGHGAPVDRATGADLFASAPIDYRGQYQWRRAGLEVAAGRAFLSAQDDPAFLAWARSTPVFDYATFRALGEAAGAPWSAWPTHLRDGVPVVTDLAGAGAAGADQARVWTHVWAQWQLASWMRKRPGEACTLYLDLPVGVSADAYEVWRHRALFVPGLAAGAPPDPLFVGGQDWGLPPLHPAQSRRTGHAYLAACVRHHMGAAGMLRIDHVMGLHRLYVVPRGRPATDGVYLRYPADELYALLTLESHRAACAITGEDLGTVPDGVRPMMERHGLYRLWVGQFAMPAAIGQAPAPAPAAAVASLGTHDTPTFAGWWRGADIDDRVALGLTTPAQAEVEHVDRRGSGAALLAYVDAHHLDDSADDQTRAMAGATLDLARGPAEIMLATLEDLWLEPDPQNVPGTSSERPNWRRPLRDGWWSADLSLLDRVAQARRAGGGA
jgi:4-alpha-glucanotransferase